MKKYKILDFVHSHPNAEIYTIDLDGVVGFGLTDRNGKNMREYYAPQTVVRHFVSSMPTDTLIKLGGFNEALHVITDILVYSLLRKAYPHISPPPPAP